MLSLYTSMTLPQLIGADASSYVKNILSIPGAFQRITGLQVRVTSELQLHTDLQP